MEDLSKDVLALLQYLAPGFLMAWAFYGLTSHPKPAQFERLVQALIFTIFIQGCVWVERKLAVLAGSHLDIGRPWTDHVDLAATIASALLMGLALAKLSNSDSFHNLLRKLGITTRSNHPSEWYQVFCARDCWVVLRTKGDGKRYMGWPRIWASNPQQGHIYLTQVQRVNDDGSTEDLASLEGILFDVTTIEWVEFLSETQGNNNGNPSPAPAPANAAQNGVP